jgi:hypothetical protein
MMIWKRSCRGLILRYYPDIRLERLRKAKKNLRQDSRTPGRDMNRALPEYEVGVLTIHPRRWVLKMVFIYIHCIKDMNSTHS